MKIRFGKIPFHLLLLCNADGELKVTGFPTKNVGAVHTRMLSCCPWGHSLSFNASLRKGSQRLHRWARHHVISLVRCMCVTVLWVLFFVSHIVSVVILRKLWLIQPECFKQPLCFVSHIVSCNVIDKK